jgi:hypothetical protein
MVDPESDIYGLPYNTFGPRIVMSSTIHFIMFTLMLN